LNTFFSSVFTDESLKNIPSLGDRSNGSHLDCISITYDDVLNELNRLKTNKSCGPDNCHPRLLKEVKDGLILPLYLLFAKSLQDGVLPSCWKDTTITAIHKNGNRKLASNYHPISLTSIFLQNAWVYCQNKIMSYFTQNNLFCVEQHGFRSMRSYF